MKEEVGARDWQDPYIGGEEDDDSAPNCLGDCQHCLRDIYSDGDYVGQDGNIFCCEECADEYEDDEMYWTRYMEEAI